jgi:hypothetical protein
LLCGLLEERRVAGDIPYWPSQHGVTGAAASNRSRSQLEVERDGRRQRARRNIVGAAERGEEIV